MWLSQTTEHQEFEMYPTLMTALADERHAELLRAAEAHRRGAALTAHRDSALSRATARIRPLLAQLRRPAPVSTPVSAGLCCA